MQRLGECKLFICKAARACPRHPYIESTDSPITSYCQTACIINIGVDFMVLMLAIMRLLLTCHIHLHNSFFIFHRFTEITPLNMKLGKFDDPWLWPDVGPSQECKNTNTFRIDVEDTAVELCFKLYRRN